MRITKWHMNRSRQNKTFLCIKVLVCMAALAGALILLFKTLPAPTRQQLITPEQAMQAVRTFENNHNLQFIDVSLEKDPPSSDYITGMRYNLKHSMYPAPARSWAVNAYTAEVESAFYGDAYLSLLGPANRAANPKTVSTGGPNVCTV
ncbi:MAG: hypothetical protein ACYC0V_18405 [Armatimonadota bacterium]